MGEHHSVHLISYSVRILFIFFSFSPAVFYDFPSIKVVCWGKCETFLALPDRADSALADFTAANRVQCPGDCCDQQPMTYFEL